MWDESDEDGLAGATVVFDGINFAEAVRRVMAMPAEQRANVASIRTDGRRGGRPHRGNRAAQRFSARLLMMHNRAGRNVIRNRRLFFT
jgi:hypothetical protein